MVTASRAVKQPAVFGRSAQPARVEHVDDRAARGRVDAAQRERREVGARGAHRLPHHLEVAKAACADDQARAERAAGDRERRSATLHRLHDLDALALAQRHLVPAPARHDLAVECHRHAAALASARRLPSRRRARSRRRRGRGRSPFSTTLIPPPSRRSAPGANGATVSGGDSPATMAATAAAVIGASRTPLRWCPVAQIDPVALADQRRVVGRPRPQARRGLDELELGHVRQHLARRLEQAEDAVGGNGRVEAALLDRRTDHYLAVGAAHDVAARRAHEPLGERRRPAGAGSGP